MSNSLGSPQSNLLDIRDPDAAIYRIYPLWFFEEALRLRQLVLVSPDAWEDPYEILTSRIMICYERSAPGQQHALGPLLRPAYAQCWSSTQESDTLLRAYSRIVKDPRVGRNTCPRDEGVRVRSTPRKLLEALLAWSPSPAAKSCFIGQVRYGNSDDIQQALTNVLNDHDTDALSDGQLRADLVLLKRSAFQHESEIRLIYIETRDVPVRSMVNVPIDPNHIFEEVTFDPRLAEFERCERETLARKLGYTGRFGQSALYTGQAMLVLLDK
jgi:hypothetical protein